MSFYCDYAIGDPVHGAYHDYEYGFPQEDESVLMERLALEIMQAGLNWGLILKKRPHLYAAFDGFEVDKICQYDDAKIANLLDDASIIRNRLKINAIIHNAKIIQSMRASNPTIRTGDQGFAAWLKAHHPKQKHEWVKLFKKTFRFTGGEITGEFLLSLGYLPNTHRPDCPAYQAILAHNPPHLNTPKGFYQDQAL